MRAASDTTAAAAVVVVHETNIMPAPTAPTLGLPEYRVGGKAGGVDGFTHTRKNVDQLKVEDELIQVTLVKRGCCTLC